MRARELESVVTWCLAACRESSAPRATFDELMEIVAGSPQWTADDLDAIRRRFIRQVLSAPGSPDSRLKRAHRHPTNGEFLASRRVASYFQPCLERCLRSDAPFEMLAKSLAALTQAPDWTADDRRELRMRVTKAILDRAAALPDDADRAEET